MDVRKYIKNRIKYLTHTSNYEGVYLLDQNTRDHMVYELEYVLEVINGINPETGEEYK